jgi:nitronate monooxygenase
VGVDAVIVVGFEGAGHPGMDDVATMVLIPRVVDSVKVPVIAAGGIADGRGLVAALALGAEGVLMGTRFMATKECPAHPKFKEMMLTAKETDTLMIQRSIKNASRAWSNEPARKVLEMESKGATLEQLLPIIRGERGREVLMNGKLDAGTASVGQAVGLIDNIPTVKELMDSIVTEALAIRQRLFTKEIRPARSTARG